mmetsp:Transcript_15620/g.27397  ORF Transcript_15620/g.27397 Transcript_15620/m.27397 type:complete len:198 (+) Transcript_15620:92-685(+)
MFRNHLCILLALMLADCKSEAWADPPPPEMDTCKGPVQSELRYGISGRKSPTVWPFWHLWPLKYPKEILAEAVCCDSRAKKYAEPQFLYQAKDIMLFSKLQSGVTTFYDSVCGIPLFRTPMNRSMAEFKDDTDWHGWPSFRSAEVYTEHVHTDETTGLVSSSCGTHLGTYAPDEKGPRWCIDLSCIAGNPVSSEVMV